MLVKARAVQSGIFSREGGRMANGTTGTASEGSLSDPDAQTSELARKTFAWETAGNSPGCRMAD
jgi:hypothetical protein